MRALKSLPKPINYLEATTKLSLIIFLLGVLSATSLDCKVYFLRQSITPIFWISFLILAIILELVSVYLQKKKGVNFNKNLKGFLKFLVVILLLLAFANIILYSPSGSRLKAGDARIRSDISFAAEEVMKSVYKNKGNYDNFNCENKDMIQICEDIDSMHGEPPLFGFRCHPSFKKDGKEPIITHDSPNNSQATCIYSPLNEEGCWHCLDSSGRKGRTKIDPGQSGYCVEEESAKCPEFTFVIPNPIQ